MPPTDPADTWDPALYERFRTERERPALDLLERIRPTPGGRAADLGCGTGRYTRLLHERVRAGETVGIDSSARMLDDAPDQPGVGFVHGDLRSLGGEWDVLYANASLQWLPDHHELLPRLVAQLRPRGQLAFQVPANFDHPSHTVADEVGRRYGLEPLDRTIGSRSAATYAEILHAAGLRDVEVVLRIYGQEMSRTDEVIAWVSGSLLSAFRRRLDPDAHEEFLSDYRNALLDRLGDPSGSGPYYYAFPRILASGQLP